MNRSREELDRLASVAVEAARAAGEVALGGFRGDLQLQAKGAKDFFTQYDTGAEEAAIAVIKRAYPGHGILAEESGASHSGEGQPDLLWAIDPIDGTHNYVMQLPFWCCSVAALDPKEDKALAGAVFDPVHNEVFVATLGGGATLNGQPIHVGTIRKLEDAGLAFDAGYDAPVAGRILDITARLQPRVRRMRLMGSAVLALAYVAAGRFDAYFHLSLQPWDIAAASLLITEAGGLVTDLQGEPASWHKGAALAANPQLHAQLLPMVGE